MYHKIYPFKVYNFMGFSVSTRLTDFFLEYVKH